MKTISPPIRPLSSALTNESKPLEKLKNIDKPLTRRQIRIKVLQAFYAVLISGEPVDRIWDSLLSSDYHIMKSFIGNETGEQDDADFMKDLFFGATKHREEYEPIIESKLENWDLNRVAIIDRIILGLGAHELIGMQEIPVKVTINEYIDIAKIFSTDRSSQFVNGILDAMLTDLTIQGKIRKVGRGLLSGNDHYFTPTIPN